MADIEWRAQPRQREYLKAKEYCMLYGGARGGGKTDAMLIDNIITCMEYPGAKCVIIRKEMAELNKSGAAIQRSHELLHGSASWRASPVNTWTFDNGSTIEFGHLSDAKAIHKYLGAQYHKISIDQAEGITYEEFNMLKGSLRGPAVFNVNTGEQLSPNIRLTANPGGIGQAWLKALFIDVGDDTKFWVDSRGDDPVISLRPIPHAQTYRFIPAKVWDNQELLKVNPDYVDQLYSVGGVLAKAWVTGDWGGFAGQYFEEFRKDKHVVKPFKIPADWPKWHATDWGYGKPSCTLWLARAMYSAVSTSGILIPKGTIIVYRERYQVKTNIPEQCLTIRTWSGNERYRNQLLDPACWGQYDANGLTFAENYARNGVSMAKAFNGRVEGWMRLRELLQWCNDHQFKPCKECLDHQNFYVTDNTHIKSCETCQNGEVSNGCVHNTFMPTLLIQSHCVNLIRTLPNLVCDQKKPEDVDTRGEDHAPDALRYAIMASDVQGDFPERSHNTLILGANRQ